jgi:hypothetical protein
MNNNPSTNETPPQDIHWTWALGGAVVTVGVLGVLIGRLSLPSPPPPAPPTGFVLDAGRVVASGEVRNALNRQAAATPSTGPVALQLSFVDTLGAYCRTFSTAANAGLACREGPDWVVHLLADASAARSAPPTVLAEVERRIVGAPLDARAEAQALERGWER